MGFLSEYVTALKQIRPRLDTYNRFGINLYLAGVCETLAKQASLTHAEFKQLLQESVEIMGTRAAQAESFVNRLNSYLDESRYGQMVQSGREAMARKQAGGGDPFASLGMVMEEWNTPKTQKVTSNTIAIVFTDLVGSTDMTSEFGDQMAQDILRAHNSAVRSALGRFSGKEIKHTGDGIMATFDHVPDAVAGMIDVSAGRARPQRGAAAHSAAHSDRHQRGRADQRRKRLLRSGRDHRGAGLRQGRHGPDSRLAGGPGYVRGHRPDLCRSRQ